MKNTHNFERREKAEKILSKAGYGKMKDLVKHGVEEHESNDHRGEKKTKMKLAYGGKAEGEKPHARLDRKARAAGGRNKHKEAKVAVNVINAGAKQPMPMPPPAMNRPPMAPPAPPPQGAPMGARPPMPPQAGGMPPSMGMPPRPGMMNKGGRAKKSGGGPVSDKKNDVPHLTGGSGGGLGRLEKSEFESKKSKKSA